MLVTQRIRGLFMMFAGCQIILAGILFWLHYVVVGSVHAEAAEPERYWIYCLLMLGGILLESLVRYQQQASLLNLTFAECHRISLQQVATAGFLVTFFLVATKDQVISRVFLFSYAVELYVVMLATGYGLPHRLAKWTFRRSRKDNTLLVGSQKSAAAIKRWLERKAPLGINPVGLLTSAPAQNGGTLKVLGGPEDFERVVREHHVAQVILVEFPNSTDFLVTMMEMCEQLGLHFLVVSDLEERFRHPIVFGHDDGMPLLGLREEVLENPVNRSLKRALDIAISLPVVCFILPVFTAIVWVLHRWQSPGPVFFTQARAGLLNQPFTMVKYRTMHVNNPNEAQQASANDPRIFTAGRWLRKLSIDELPQFWNVLRGDMSVAGPRPHLPQHNEMFARVMRNYHIRAQVKPGITGLAQVRGFRGEATSEEVLRHRIQSDIYYLENWSLGLDVMIVFRTAWQVFRPPKTAY